MMFQQLSDSLRGQRPTAQLSQVLEEHLVNVTEAGELLREDAPDGLNREDLLLQHGREKHVNNDLHVAHIVSLSHQELEGGLVVHLLPLSECPEELVTLEALRQLLIEHPLNRPGRRGRGDERRGGQRRGVGRGGSRCGSRGGGGGRR